MKNPATTRTIANVGKAFVLCALTIAASPLYAGPPYRPKEPARPTPCPASASTCATRTITIKPGQLGHSKLVDCVRSLDALRSKVEEWGTVTISAPVAVVDSSAFALPAEILTPKEMFDKVLVERSASVVQATELALSARMAASLSPTTTTESTTTDTTGQTSSTTTTTKTTPPSTTAPQLPAQPDAADLGLGSKNATKPFELLPGLTPPGMSVGDAMRQTDNNIMQHKIFSQLTKARDIAGHSRVIFCLVQVSCNPGWRTKENYIGDCSASLEYYNMVTRQHLPRGEQRAPKVFSVLPLMDAHTVEMANSQREVTSLALQLAGSMAARGTNISANSLFQFVKRFSKDMRSVTPMPVVNSYSSGGTFGFRFSPSFQALRDPAEKKSKAANVLLPRTFPALITVVIEDEDIKFAARSVELNGRSNVRIIKDIDKDPLPQGFAINTHISTRWYLKDRPKNWEVKKWIFDNTRRDTVNLEVRMAEHLAEFYQAKCYLKDLDLDTTRDRFSPVYEELRRQVLDLECKGLGRDWPIPLERNFFDNVGKMAKALATNVDLDKAKTKIEELTKERDKAKADLDKKDLQHLMLENELMRELLNKKGPRPGLGDVPPPNPGKGGQASIEAPANEPVAVSEPAAVVDEKELRLDDTLLLPGELQDGTYPTEPLPPLPAGSRPAPRKQVAKATPAPAPPAPKKATVSVLTPHLALDRATPPLRR